MTINADQVVAPQTITNMVPIGGVESVFRSGDAYKAVGEVVLRSAYPALSAAFPRNGSAYGVSAGGGSNNIYLRAHAYGAGIHVIVGGTVDIPRQVAFYSTDGVSWYSTVMPANKEWVAVAFGAGIFTAIAATGEVATSPDGVVWTARVSLSGTGWTDICFGGSAFVAICGGSSTAASSADGITFTARTLPSSSTWSAVTYGAGKYVAVTGSTAAATSPDGITWTARNLPSGTTWTDVVYGAGLFVVCGTNGLATSPDGITWSSRIGAAGRAIAFGNGVFAIPTGTSQSIHVSYDGINWKQKTAVQGAGGNNAIGYGAGAFVSFSTSVNGNNSNTCAYFIENTTDSDYMYISGPAGQFVRVK